MRGPPIDRRALLRAAVALVAACTREQPGSADAGAAPTPKPSTSAGPSPPRRGPSALVGAHGTVAKLARVALADVPTPVERAPVLGARAGIDALWVKRDDLSSTVFGGGKVRKLEWLLGAARESACERVVTFGGVGSNHAVATAAFARELGMSATVFLAPQPPSADVRDNLLALTTLGADVRAASSVTSAEEDARRSVTAGETKAACVVPTGGTSPLGNLGFVDAGFELAAQVRAGAMPEPDVVYLAGGTLGATAGLAVGLAASGLRSRVVCVRASSPSTSSRGRLSSQIDETVALLRKLAPRFPDVRSAVQRVSIDGTHLGDGYGVPTPACLAALSLARDLEGWRLDATYTAKALASILADPSLRGRTVLFWNTHAAHPIDIAAARPSALPPALSPYLSPDGGS